VPAPTPPTSSAQPKGEGQNHRSFDLSLLEALAPKPPPSRDSAPPTPDPESATPQSADPPPRTREWYEITWAADQEALERRRYRGYYEAQRVWFEDRRRDDLVRELRDEAEGYYDQARWLIKRAHDAYRSGKQALADRFLAGGRQQERLCYQRQDLAEEVRDGRVVPDITFVDDGADFRRINDDVAELASGGLETGNRSALTGDDDPLSIDQTRPYGERGGLRPPLALHQTDLERQMPREPDGSVARTADPRQGRWFSLVNDGGPSADATRSINCLDCTLSLYETWVHGRPRVSAPRTFDGYLQGDVNRPIDGEWGGPGRVERVTGGVYQQVTSSTEWLSPAAARQQVLQGYADLHQQLLAGGHGSFAFLVNTWEGGGAHAWVALNQNGTVLYLDPQVSTVSDRPPYVHRGVSHPGNVASLEALVIGPDGRPMPLPGRGLGDFSEQRPSTEEQPSASDDDELRHRRYALGTLSGGSHADLAAPGAQPQPSPEGRPAESARGDRLAEGQPDAEALLAPYEWRALTLLRARADDVADEVEDALAGVGYRITQALGLDRPVELRDQEHRLKSLNSLARKFYDEAVAVGISVDEFAREVNDVLRFSFGMPSGARYTHAVDLLIAELRSVGFIIDDGDCKNFWYAGNRFYGFNCTLRAPNGQLLELQLHTDASRRAWLGTHLAYEVLRRPNQSAPDRVHAFLQMLSLNRSEGIPQAVPEGLSGRFAQKDATFAKWISVNRAVWLAYRQRLEDSGASFADVVRRYGLTREDFPIATKILAGLEKVDVDLLRDLPER
jgi:hypothetical protein